MKITAAITGLLVAMPLASGFVIEMFTGTNCEGSSLGQRNIWDNTCAYVNPGFSSFRIIANGWAAGQQGTVYSPQACAGTHVWGGCVTGVNAIKAGSCQNMFGVGNAISSYSNIGFCPN